MGNCSADGCLVLDLHLEVLYKLFRFLVLAVALLKQIVQYLLVGISIDVGLGLAWCDLLLVFRGGEHLRLAVFLVSLERRYLVFFRDVSEFTVGLGDLGTHLVERFFLVIIALKHFLRLIHVFLGDLFWGAYGSIGDTWSLWAFALLPLIHYQVLDASEKCFLVDRLCLVLRAEELKHDLVGHILIN